MKKTIAFLTSVIIAAGISTILGCAHIGNNNINLPGRSTTVSKCSACHIAPEARSLNPKSLDEALTAHSKRVRLTSDEIENIRLFLVEGESQKDKFNNK